MARQKVWTKEEVDDKIYSLVDKGWSVQQIATSLGLSRQRVYKLLKDNSKGG